MSVYLDNHATTRVDPRVVAAMTPCWTEHYGNPGSVSHEFGRQARELVEQARESIAQLLDVGPRELVFTSGATESNNLALLGAAQRVTPPARIISVQTEHKAVLDPLQRLARAGWDVVLLPVVPAGQRLAGRLELQRLADALAEQPTALVSVMPANNEIGVLQDIPAIGELCQRHGALLHCDATQAVGKLPLRLSQLPVDLLSFTAHKIYGPKGVGALYIRRRSPRVRLTPQIVGGGQERGFRSGTLNVPGIVGLARALELCVDELPEEMQRLSGLRQRLWEGLQRELPEILLNGPPLDTALRLPGNLNCSFPGVDGEALMMSTPELAVSSGSACTSADPTPSHVLLAMGLSEDLTRASLRFGLGRFNTEADVDFAIQAVGSAVARLRSLA